MWTIVSFVCAIVVICALKIMYQQMKTYENVDKPNFSCLIKLVQRIFDLMTDILVCYTMYRCNNNQFDEYVYASVSFIFIPMVASITITIYHVCFKWNENFNTKMSDKYTNHNRIMKYMNDYQYFIFLISIICCDFYCAIRLAQSKLFCLQIFNLQLKSSEKRSLIVWKFINQTLCENIPQMIIQILYLTNTSNGMDEIENDSLLIVLSLFLSIISILSQIVLFLIELNNILIEYNSFVQHITYFDVKISLQSPQFRYKHQFMHSKVNKVLRNSLSKDKDLSELFNRQDIKLNHCVYYIDNTHLKSKQKIYVYFEVNAACYNDSDSKIRHKIALKLNELGDSNCILHEQALHRFKVLFGVNTLEIGKDCEIMSQKRINKEYNNGTLLQLSIWRGVVTTKIESITPGFITNRTQKDLEFQLRLPPKPLPNLIYSASSGSAVLAHGQGRKDNTAQADKHHSDSDSIDTILANGGNSNNNCNQTPQQNANKGECDIASSIDGNMFNRIGATTW